MTVALGPNPVMPADENRHQPASISYLNLIEHLFEHKQISEALFMIIESQYRHQGVK